MSSSLLWRVDIFLSKTAGEHRHEVKWPEPVAAISNQSERVSVLVAATNAKLTSPWLQQLRLTVGVWVSENVTQAWTVGWWVCFSPADVCLNFSLFFFLHFQGLNSRPRVANLLRRRMGGVCVPGTSESERMTAKRSTSSAANMNMSLMSS